MTTSSHERTDVYASITDQIIAAIETSAGHSSILTVMGTGPVHRQRLA